jgi:uncharacterized lipoprotein
MRQPLVMRWVAAFVLVLALAGCKSKSASPSSPSAGTSSSSTPGASCVIPQGNGGDHDADNNGGPDDGDGCDK